MKLINPHAQTHTPKQKNDVKAQTSPIKETSSQVSGSDTESPLENQTRSIQVQCPNDSNKQQNEIQRNEIGLTTYDNGDDNISPPEITTSQIQEQLVRDDITNELYMPLSSTIVLKRKKEMLYVPLDFENGLTIDALVDSGAYVSAIAQKELDRIQKQALSNILKIDDPPNFQILVANGLLEKPTATATLKFDIGDHIFAEHFVVAQRKPNGKLRLLVDLRKINTLIADDYTNNNHPVSTLSDAAQHLAGKSLLCKLECSQAFHCLQMADQRSVEMLAFNFASRTFGYKRLAQGLSRSVSAFSSLMREYLDPVVKADQCAQ